MVKLSWGRAAAWRMGRHHLEQRAPAGSMIEVASRISGLHLEPRLEDLTLNGAVSRAAGAPMRDHVDEGMFSAMASESPPGGVVAVHRSSTSASAWSCTGLLR